MLSIDDCLNLCRLAEDEFAAIAGQQGLSDIITREMSNYLCIDTFGHRRLSRMIADDIETARAYGNLAHAAKLRLVLQYFLENHAGIRLTEQQKKQPD